MMQDKLLILIAGLDLEPWKSRTQECFDTWGGVFQDLGYTVKAITPDPELGGNYRVEKDTLWAKAEINQDLGGTSRLLNSFKWVIEQTDFEYVMLADNDTFIHPHRFLKAFEECKEKYKDNFHYWGCCHPWRGDKGWEMGKNAQYEIPPKYSFTFKMWKGSVYGFEKPYKEHFANGAGYMVSREAIKNILKEATPDAFEDLITCGMSFEMCNDIVVGRSLGIYSGIRLIHDCRMLAFSPGVKQGWIEDNVVKEENFPYIGEGWADGSEVILQHYVGIKNKDERLHMKNIMKYLNLKK